MRSSGSRPPPEIMQKASTHSNRMPSVPRLKTVGCLVQIQRATVMSLKGATDAGCRIHGACSVPVQV